MYPEYKNLQYAEINQEILKFWQENKIFEKSVSSREGKKVFNFYEGPPSANGTPGIHHVMARAIKDIFCRYKTLQGFQVKRKAGWDTHGLPVELQVEKELKITKDDIGKTISIEAYNQKCRETVMKYTDQWNSLTEQMGYWVDLSDPYITYENTYIESLWWLLKELYNKKTDTGESFLYKGYSVQPYSPAAGTGLSSHELNLPDCYKDVTDTSITAQFKVKYSEKSAFLFHTQDEDVRILAWTTTPWTLPSNCALAVGEKIMYVKVRSFNPYTFEPVSVVLAKDLLHKYFSEKAKEIAFVDYKAGDKLIPFEIEKEFTGKDLLEIRYEQLLSFVTNQNLEENAFRVIAGDFVTTSDGTGIVHTASVFGADDFRVCKQNNIPSVMVLDENNKETPLVDKKGKFVAEVGKGLLSLLAKYPAGIKVHKTFGENDFYVKNYLSEDEKQENYKSTDEIVAILLKLENKAFKVERYVHSYPHCWRTGKPVLYYPLDSWFIRTTAMKDKMVALNKTINWKPESTGTGRFGNWLENLVDWNLSRSRYWGTPLPIWRTENGLQEKCIGSMEELSKEIAKANEKLNKNQPLALPDLHRPYVDDVVLVSENGEPMYREADLIDVWFDSGAMPYAQWNYPFGEQKDLNQVFPADFISEGVDQTRGWFFTLHAISSMLFDSVAFKNVVSTGLVLDKEGNKMSKSKGNVINPFETLDKYGADSVRWYMVENANPWDNLKFDFKRITEVQNRFFGTLYNTYNFFALYANLDNWQLNSASKIAHEERPELDRWILSKLQTMILEVEAAYDDYEPTKVARAVQEFVCEDLSNWFLRLSRRRFWKGEMSIDKQSAYETLYECLLVTSQVMSPIAPFFADWLFKNLSNTNESVHLTNWKAADKNLVNEGLEEKMRLAQKISSLTHSLRKKEKLKVRQPLEKILVPVTNAQMKTQIEAVKELILAEVNIKNIAFIDDTSGILIKSVKPNFKRLGEIYKAKVKEVVAVINLMKKEDIIQIEKTGLYEAETSDGFVTLTLEDVVIESKDIEGWSVASEGGLTVALDITLNENLKMEGIARDLVNRIQNLRKDMNLEIADKIKVEIQKTNNILANQAFEVHKAYITDEVQAVAYQVLENVQNPTELDMDDFILNVSVQTA